MFRNFTLFILFIFCFSLNVEAQWKNRYPKNSYQFAIIEDFNSVVNKDTIFLKKLKFGGVNNVHYLQKGMYDRFGKWDQSLYKKQNDTLLIWDNIKLFNALEKSFKVASVGKRIGAVTYSSVLVFDENNNDMLSEDSAYREQLTNYFGSLIKTNNENDVDFYIDFYKMFEANKNWRAAAAMRKKYEKIKKKNLRRQLKNKN